MSPDILDRLKLMNKQGQVQPQLKLKVTKPAEIITYATARDRHLVHEDPPEMDAAASTGLFLQVT